MTAPKRRITITLARRGINCQQFPRLLNCLIVFADKNPTKGLALADSMKQFALGNRYK
jgi:hypothetical protein